MTDHKQPAAEPASSNQLHPTELHDQVSHGETAPGADVRTAGDAATTSSGAMGAVETEVTPMTPPSAASDSDPDGRANDETYDPHVEIEGGG